MASLKYKLNGAWIEIPMLIGEKGQDGKNGLDGLAGIDGKDLEFIWDNTRLGIRKIGELEYIYVDLKGDRGIQGEIGFTGANGEDIFVSNSEANEPINDELLWIIENDSEISEDVTPFMNEIKNARVDSLNTPHINIDDRINSEISIINNKTNESIDSINIEVTEVTRKTNANKIDIGGLNLLSTTIKDNLVNAINEIKNNPSIDENRVNEIINEVLNTPKENARWVDVVDTNPSAGKITRTTSMNFAKNFSMKGNTVKSGNDTDGYTYTSVGSEEGYIEIQNACSGVVSKSKLYLTTPLYKWSSSVFDEIKDGYLSTTSIIYTGEEMSLVDWDINSTSTNITSFMGVCENEEFQPGNMNENFYCNKAPSFGNFGLDRDKTGIQLSYTQEGYPPGNYYNCIFNISNITIGCSSSDSYITKISRFKSWCRTSGVFLMIKGNRVNKTPLTVPNVLLGLGDNTIKCNNKITPTELKYKVGVNEMAYEYDKNLILTELQEKVSRLEGYH